MIHKRQELRKHCERHKSNWLRFLASFTALALCLSSCGPASPMQTDESTQESRPAEWELVDALEKSWVGLQSDAKDLKGWEITEYYRVADSAPSSEGWTFHNDNFHGAEGDFVYFLKHYLREVEDGPDEYAYVLTGINTVTLERTDAELSLSGDGHASELNQEAAEDLAQKMRGGYARVKSLDVNRGSLCLMIAAWDEQWNLQHCYLAETGADGKLRLTADLVGTICGKEEDRTGQFYVPEAVCSPDHTVYLLDNEKRTITAIGPSGEVLAVHDFGDVGKAPISFVGKSINGIPVYSLSHDRGEVRFCSLDRDKRTVLYDNPLNAAKCSLDDQGNLLLLEGAKLTSWSVLEGRWDRLYNFEGLSAYNCWEILRNSRNEIVTCFGQGGETFLYKLSDAPQAETVQIDFLQVVTDSYTSTCAAEYSRSHPGIKINVRKMEGSGEMELNRLMEEMKAENGPDLLYVNRDRLNVLQGADALMPLDSLLSPELRENLFAGALKFGEYETGLYAIPYEAYLQVLLVADDVWPKNSWTLREAMDAFSAWKKENKNARRFESISYAVNAEQLLYDLCMQNVEDSAFLDLEKSECNFKTQEFYDLLRFCKEVAEPEGSVDHLTAQDMAEEVLEGQSMTYAAVGGLIQYSGQRAVLGDGYHPVGYPSEKGNASIISCYWGVAVSKWTKHPEIVSDFLQFMLSEENQVKYATNWIRKDVLREHVREHAPGDPNLPGYSPVVFVRENGSVTPLAGREDGSSYVEEYIALMDQGVFQSTLYDVLNIVMEEAGAYFAGAKSEYEVADVIQNRVRLLLKE